MSNLLDTIQLALTHQFETISLGSAAYWPYHYVLSFLHNKEVTTLKALRHKIELGTIQAQCDHEFVKHTRLRAYQEILEIIELTELRDDLEQKIKSIESNIEALRSKVPEEYIEVQEAVISGLKVCLEIKDVKTTLEGIDILRSALEQTKMSGWNLLRDHLDVIWVEFYTRHTNGMIGPDAKYV